MNRADLAKQGPTMDLDVAGGYFNISRTKVYEMARNRPEELPFRIVRVGSRYRVLTHSVIEALDLPEDDGIDWKAHSRKWERLAKDRLRIIHGLQAVLGVNDSDDLAESA